MLACRLEFRKGKSQKFWSISAAGKKYNVTFGRIGTKGRTITKLCSSSIEAEITAAKLQMKKLDEGYDYAIVGATTESELAKKSSKAKSRPVVKNAPRNVASRSAKEGRFADVVEFLARVEDPKQQKRNNRSLLSQKEVAKLRRKFPGVPEEFLDYLLEIGGGSLRECQFTVYGDLATPNERIGIEDPTERFLAFGDDFSETMSGFLPESNWIIAEIGYNGGKPRRIRQSFGKYLRQKILMGPKGQDLRA